MAESKIDVTGVARRRRAFVVMALLGATLLAGQCMAPPPGPLGRRDAGAPRQPDAAVDEAGPEQKLDEAAQKRIAGLKGVKRVHLLAVTGPLDAEGVSRLKKALAAIPAGEAVVLEIDSAGGTPKAARRAQALLAAAKPFTVALITGAATGEAAVLPLSCNVVAMTRGAKWGAFGPTQLTGTRLGEPAEKQLEGLFVGAAQKQNRPVIWARAMVRAPGAAAPPAGKPAPAMIAGMKPAKPAPAKTPGRKPAKPAQAKTPGRKPAKPAPAKTPKAGEPAAGRLVTLTAARARKLGMSELTVAGVKPLLSRLGLTGVEVLRSGKVVQGLAGKSTDGLPRRNIDPKKVVAGTRRVVVVDLKSEVNLGLLPFLPRVIGDAKKGDLVIVDVDTFGGRVDVAVKIRDALLRSKAKTVAFVNPRAISAGALISLACDLIAMAPGGSIGAATPITIQGGKAHPVGEKIVSYMRKEMKSTAEAKGRRGDLAEAMVDLTVEVQNVPHELKESISGLKKGKLLTLTTKEALQLDMVEMQVANLEDLLDQLGAAKVPLVRPKENWAEKVAQLLTSRPIAFILMILGLLGLYLESKTPGFGLMGGMGVACLLLFFFGHKVAGLAGWEPMVLFVIGVGLLFVEIFITPGFGVLGALGILGVVASLVWALIGAGGVPLSVSWHQGYITSALTLVFGALIVSFVLLLLLIRFLPKNENSFLGRLVLHAEVHGVASAGAHHLPADVGSAEELVGREGEAVTPLRPTGKAKLGDKRLEVESGGEFIARGTRVRVIEVDGRRIVVKEVRR